MLPSLSWFPARHLLGASTCGHPDLADWLVQARVFGLDWVDLPRRLLPTGDLAAAASLRRLLEELGLGVGLVPCGGDLTDPDPGARASALEALRWDVDVARELGAVGLGVSVGPDRADVPRGQALAWAADHLARLGDYAEARHVRLALASAWPGGPVAGAGLGAHRDAFLHLVALLRDTPIGVSFDTSAALLTGSDPTEALDAVGARVWHVQASDRLPGRRELVPLGEGAVDFDALFRLLAARRYEGFISLVDVGPGDDVTQRGLRFLRRKALRWRRSGR